MRYRAYLFDFDYTLGDSAAAIIDCFNYALERLNLPTLDGDTIKCTIGLALEDAFLRTTGIDDPEAAAQFRAHFRERGDEIMTAKTVLFGDTLPTLAFLRDQGAKIGIVSSKNGYRIEEVFAVNGASELLDCIVGFSDVSRPKPDPEGLLRAAEILGTSTREILYIGDNTVDAAAAAAAGIDFTAVTTGVTEAKEFLPFPHRAVLPNLSMLCRHPALVDPTEGAAE